LYLSGKGVKDERWKRPKTQTSKSLFFKSQTSKSLLGQMTIFKKDCEQASEQSEIERNRKFNQALETLTKEKKGKEMWIFKFFCHKSGRFKTQFQHYFCYICLLRVTLINFVDFLSKFHKKVLRKLFELNL